MARRSAFEISLAAAVALHVLGIALLARVRPPAPPPAPHRQPLQIEIETLPAVARTEPAAAAPSRAPARGADRRLAMIERGARRSHAPSATLEAPPHATLPARAAPSPAPAPAHAPSLGLDELGVGANNPLLGSRFGSAPARAARAPNVAPGIQRSMAQAEVDRDARIGLGPQGPVLSALEVATSRAPGPLNGHARFTAVVSGEGKLESFDVIDVGEAYATWRAIAKRVLAALAGRRLHQVASGRAVRLVVDVVSREALPSGAKPGFKIPITFDLSDIGAQTSRVVHVHLVSTVVL